MTLDTASRSDARIKLGYMLGEARVNLSELRPEELDELLSRYLLQQIDLRELRDYTMLKLLLTKMPSSSGIGIENDTPEVVQVSESCTAAMLTSSGHALSMESYVVALSKKVIRETLTYKHSVSGEETDDQEVVRGWEADEYVVKVRESVVVLRRPYDRSRFDENLFLLEYERERGSRSNLTVVTDVRASNLLISEFHAQFGDKHSVVARDLIWLLADLVENTAREYEHQAKLFREAASGFKRISGSVTA